MSNATYWQVSFDLNLASSSKKACLCCRSSVFQFYFSTHQELARKSGGTGSGWNVSISGLQSDVTLLCENVCLKENYGNNGRHEAVSLEIKQTKFLVNMYASSSQYRTVMMELIN
jgi:hypothetical protein